MTKQPVLIVGSMAFDDLELPTGKFPNVVGGSATYGSFTASIYTEVRTVAVVGEDFPQRYLDQLQKRNVDISGIERAKGKTFRWAGRYSANLAARDTLDTQLNVFADFQPKLPPAFRTSPYLLLGNIHPALQLAVLDQLDNPKWVVADTMNFWIEGELPTLQKLLKRINTLVVNDEEVRQLSGEHNIVKAARAVQQMGPERIIIKRGEHGALLFDKDGAFFAPAYPLEDVLDPTGAGDSFAGGLMGYLATQPELTGLSLRRGLIVAATCASFCVEAVGSERLEQLNAKDISERLSEFYKLTHFGEF
jgi:sugar/nucleoside kinase (ribokinase family)